MQGLKWESYKNYTNLKMREMVDMNNILYWNWYYDRYFVYIIYMYFVVCCILQHTHRWILVQDILTLSVYKVIQFQFQL